MPLPIIDFPFERIAMDIIGLLPRTKAGNRYMLTLMDYGSRSPDLCRLMDIKQLKISPYHPQTDGMLERFHATLKAMIQKTVHKFNGQWDQALPYVLFAYREVVCESTGFSPFELLYSRIVRGPLQLLTETWTEEGPPPTDVVTYVYEVQNRLKSIQDASREIEVEAKRKAKIWYDRTALSRTFQVGDQVLVLMPGRRPKSQTEWEGPFTIEKQVTKVTCQIIRTDKSKSHRIYHVNMLKPWITPPAVCLLDHTTSCVPLGKCSEVVGEHQDTTEHSDEEEDEEAMLETWKQLHTEGEIVLELGTSLEQAAELKDLVDAFRKSVYSGRTKQTPFTELQIWTKDAQPIHLPPYRMSRARHECVRTEIKKMLEADLIRPSTSPWASPIVLVPKKDGSWRFCVNYQKLNAVTEADPFPISRVDNLLNS